MVCPQSPALESRNAAVTPFRGRVSGPQESAPWMPSQGPVRPTCRCMAPAGKPDPISRGTKTLLLLFRPQGSRSLTLS